MLWQRIKNLWEISKVTPFEVEIGKVQEEKPLAPKKHYFVPVLDSAVFIPRITKDPIRELVNEEPK